MKRLYFILISSIFSLFLGKAQLRNEDEQLLLKAKLDLIDSPEKSGEIVDYFIKNNSHGAMSSEFFNLQIKSLYYQGKYEELFSLIIERPPTNDEGNIIVSNILQSLGIEKIKSTSTETSSLQKINDDINLLTKRIQNNNLKNITNDVNQLRNSIKDDRAYIYRENVLMLCFSIIEKMENRALQNGLSSSLVKLCDIYAGDYMFDFINIQSLIISGRIEKATELWNKLPSEILKNSSNEQLKLQFYKTNSALCFEKDDKPGYLEARKAYDVLAENVHQKEIKARSFWFYLAEKDNQQKLELAEKTSRIILLSALIIIGISVIITVIRLFQIRSQTKEYKYFLEKLQSFTQKKPSPQIISEKVEQELLIKLKDYENSYDFISPNVTLQSLSKKLDTNTKYLSETINKHRQKNFNTYINELRVGYIMQKIRDEAVYRNYKIKYLAEESGFSTHSQFTSVFKSVTGMSPANYIQLINEEK